MPVPLQPTRVTTTNLEMTSRPALEPRPLPDEVRLERASGITPEYARFLYALVGGPWKWVDQLPWTREQWAADLARPGTEFWVLYGEGVPWGYAHLQPVGHDDGVQVEVRYFGLAEAAIGRGLGRAMLEQVVARAWDMPAVTRVWLHTCTLDGPAALANYRARGFEVFGVEESEELVPEQPLGSWASAGGPPSP